MSSFPIMLQGFVQIFLTLFLVVVSVPMVGHYLAEVFLMERTWLDAVMNPLESLIYLLMGIEPQESMTGKAYAIAVLLSNTAMAVLALLLLMFQSFLPLRSCLNCNPKYRYQTIYERDCCHHFDSRALTFFPFLVLGLVAEAFQIAIGR